jgi:hypothetical protein
MFPRQRIVVSSPLLVRSKCRLTVRVESSDDLLAKEGECERGEREGRDARSLGALLRSGRARARVRARRREREGKSWSKEGEVGEGRENGSGSEERERVSHESASATFCSLSSALLW